MERFPKNVTVVFVDDSGGQNVLSDFSQLYIVFENIDENIFRELLVYTTTLTRSNRESTLAVFQDGAMCSYPNRNYNAVKELLIANG